MTARAIVRAGLTGGIASGKTTVAGFFREFGAFVLDADRIAHELISPDGAAYRDVVARFGREILDANDAISRPRLGAIVFADAAARADLDRIVHPRILPEVDRRIAAYLESGHAPVAIVDAALLVESGIYKELDALVVVRCSRETQIRRLMARNGFSEEEAVARLAAQAPLEDKLAVADWTIDTEGTIKGTRAETERVWRGLVALRPGPWSSPPPGP